MVNDDRICPRCNVHLNSDLGTEGWIDADGKTWESTAMLCPGCGIYFGLDSSSQLIEAAAIIPSDDLSL